MNFVTKKMKAEYEKLNKKFDSGKNDIGGLTIEEYHRLATLYNRLWDRGCFKKK